MKKLVVLLTLFLISTSYSQTSINEATSYLKAGKISDAKIILKEKISNNKSDWETLELLGDIASFEENWDAAMSYYSKLAVSNPRNASFNLKYGGALGMKALSVSKLEALVYIPDVKKYLVLAASLDPSQIESRRALVELYVKLPGILGGSDEKAMMYANQLKEISPVNAYLAKGFILKENESLEDALVHYKNAFNTYKSGNTGQKSNVLNYELGKLSAELNIELKYGNQLLDTYIKNYNYKDLYSLEWAYLRKAQIMKHLKIEKEALANIEKALTLKPDFKEALSEKERIKDL